MLLEEFLRENRDMPLDQSFTKAIDAFMIGDDSPKAIAFLTEDEEVVYIPFTSAQIFEQLTTSIQNNLKSLLEVGNLTKSTLVKSVNDTIKDYPVKNFYRSEVFGDLFADYQFSQHELDRIVDVRNSELSSAYISFNNEIIANMVNQTDCATSILNHEFLYWLRCEFSDNPISNVMTEKSENPDMPDKPGLNLMVSSFAYEENARQNTGFLSDLIHQKAINLYLMSLRAMVGENKPELNSQNSEENIEEFTYTTEEAEISNGKIGDAVNQSLKRFYEHWSDGTDTSTRDAIEKRLMEIDNYQEPVNFDKFIQHTQQELIKSFSHVKKEEFKKNLSELLDETSMQLAGLIKPPSFALSHGKVI